MHDNRDDESVARLGFLRTVRETERKIREYDCSALRTCVAISYRRDEGLPQA